MGYNIRVSAPRPPGPRSALEEAMLQIKSLESLEVLGKLIYNAAVMPKEEKYRRVKLSNAKINAVIVNSPGCLQTLLEMGWESDTQDAECLIITPGKFMTMTEVRKIEEAKERCKKEQAEELKERLRKESQRSSAASGVTAADPASASVQVQA